MEVSRRVLRQPRQQAMLVATVLGLVALVGCGKSETRVATFPVEGSLQFNGQAAPGAMLVLHPQSSLPPNTPLPKGEVGTDGKFKFTTFSAGDGAPAGEYRVTVKWRPRVTRNGELELGSNVLPKEYSAVATTPLKIQVAEAPNELEPILIRQ